MTAPRGTIAEAEEALASPQHIPINKIDPHPDNPRTNFDEAELEALGASLANLEQLHPIHVQPHGNGRYRLLTGERRWRAAKLIGRKTIAAFVRNVEPHQAVLILAEDNLQHVALNPLDKARAYALMIRPKEAGGAGMNQAALAKRLKISPAQVNNTLRVLKLPSEWQERIARGEIGFRQAKALVSYADRPDVLTAVAKELADNPAAWDSAAGFEANLSRVSGCQKHNPGRAAVQLTTPEETVADTEIFPRGNPAQTDDRTGQQEGEMALLTMPALTRRSGFVNHDTNPAAKPSGESRNLAATAAAVDPMRLVDRVTELVSQVETLDDLEAIKTAVAARAAELQKPKRKGKRA